MKPDEQYVLKTTGVVLLHLSPGAPFTHCIAVSPVSGRLIYEGHPNWVRAQLAKYEVPIKKEHGPNCTCEGRVA